MEGIALTGKYVYIKYVAILYSIMYKSYYRAVDNGLGIKKIAARIIFKSYLGVGDELVATLTAGVAAALLYVLHGEVPQGEVVGEHVEVGQHGSSEGIHLRRQVQS